MPNSFLQTSTQYLLITNTFLINNGWVTQVLTWKTIINISQCKILLHIFPASLLMIPKDGNYYKCRTLFSDLADTLYLFMLTHTFKVFKLIYINPNKSHVTFAIMNIFSAYFFRVFNCYSIKKTRKYNIIEPFKMFFS